MTDRQSLNDMKSEIESKQQTDRFDIQSKSNQTKKETNLSESSKSSNLESTDLNNSNDNWSDKTVRAQGPHAFTEEIKF